MRRQSGSVRQNPGFSSGSSSGDKTLVYKIIGSSTIRSTEMQMKSANNKFRERTVMSLNIVHPKCGPPGTGVQNT